MISAGRGGRGEEGEKGKEGGKGVVINSGTITGKFV